MASVVFNDFYPPVGECSSSTGGVDALILLNSPSLGSWEQQFYKHLASQPKCKFIVCADGAIRFITKANEDLSVKWGSSSISSGVKGELLPMPQYLCGDLDSIPKDFPTTSDPTPPNTNPNPNPPNCRVRCIVVDSVPDLTSDELEHGACRERLTKTTSPVSNEFEGEKPIVTVVHVKDQDTTDFEKCVQLTHRLLALHHKYQTDQGGAKKENDAVTIESSGEQLMRRIAVLGASGGRLDHELSALNVLARAASTDDYSSHGNPKGIEMQLLMCSPFHTTFALKPNSQTEFRLNPQFEAPTCGLIPMCSATKGLKIETRGLKWDFDHAFCDETPLGWGGVLSTSNRVVGVPDGNGEDGEDSTTTGDSTSSTNPVATFTIGQPTDATPLVCLFTIERQAGELRK